MMGRNLLLGAGLLGLASLLAPAAGAASYPPYIPRDSKLVVTLNVPALAADKKAQKGWRAAGRHLYTQQLFPELAKPDAFAVTDVKRVILAFRFLGSTEALLILDGKVDAKKLAEHANACAKLDKDLIIHKPGDKQPATIYERRLSGKRLLEMLPPGAEKKVPPLLLKLLIPNSAYFAAIDDSTLVVSLRGKIPVVRAQEAVKAKVKPKLPEVLSEALKEQDDKAGASFVLLEDPLHPFIALARPKAKEYFDQFERVLGGVCTGKEIELKLAATARDDDVANEVESQAKHIPAALKKALPELIPNKKARPAIDELSKSVRTQRNDRVVTTTMKLSAARARELGAALAAATKPAREKIAEPKVEE
jgi:hypothetical protein